MERVNSVVKAVRILDELRHRGPSTFSEMHQATGLPKSTVHKILGTLESEEIVRRDPESGRYSLGVKLIEWGGGARAQLEVRKVALPLLQELSEDLDCTIHLSVLSHGEVLPIESFESGSKTWPQYVFHGGVGIPAPLHATAAGKAIIAFLDDAARVAALGTRPLHRYTRNTIADRAKLQAELATIRRQGYAVSDGEHFEMVRGVAAPIVDADARVVASLAALGIVDRLTPARIPEVAKKVVRTALEISRQAGYLPAGAPVTRTR